MNQDPTVLYEYATGALSFYASVTQLGYAYDSNGPVFGGQFSDATTMAVGAAYAAGGYKVAIGYERHDSTLGAGSSYDVDNLILGADATFGAFTVKARYSEGGSTFADVLSVQNHKQWALSGTYTQDALSVTGFASHKQFTNGTTGANLFEADALGLGASYDLGGGASVKGGIVQLETRTGAALPVKDTAFDLGLSFTF
jgi:outer membrane protein OmpU